MYWINIFESPVGLFQSSKWTGIIHTFQDCISHYCACSHTVESAVNSFTQLPNHADKTDSDCDDTAVDW